MIDFLIIYEVEQRELENITLLGAELEKRGYSVCYEKFMFQNPVRLREKYKNKVKAIIIHSTYDDITIYNLAYSIVGFASKIVNLQWEQVGSVDDETSLDSYRYPKKTAKSVPHICWGEKIREILIKCGMSEERVPVTGPIHMDFFRKEFDGYYIVREDLFKEFDIPADKKVMLFISSFSYTSLTDKQINTLSQRLKREQIESFRKVSLDSQKAILEWLEKYLNENKDTVFIYRPHPAEMGNKLLMEYEKRNDRFFVINKYSVKQWIKTTDVIFNWFSTSMAEVYFDGKDAFVLRPVKLEEGRDVAIMKGCRFIETYEDFEKAAKGSNDMVASTDAIRAYYDVTDVPAFIRCADYLEDVVNTDKYDYIWSKELRKDFKKRYAKYLLKQSVINARHFMRFVIHNIRKFVGVSYDAQKAEFYKRNKEQIAYHRKAQNEKLEVMRKIVRKFH